jgi:LmbE family N-acetylglucosaminyl deacetylase
LLTLGLGASSAPLDVVCIGAHADDIEIGCAATLLQLAGSRPLTCHWIVLTADEERGIEARSSAAALLGGVAELDVRVASFPESYFPYVGRELKDFVQALARDLQPDVVLTHQRDDLHQDHRLTSELCWNAFRDHLVLEYEIPKYDGDLGRPNVYVAIEPEIRDRKIEHLMSMFPSQAGRDWYHAETFTALLRLRGVESHSPTGYAEAFYGRKLLLSPTG